MRYHWTKEQLKNGEFTVVWHPGTEALADLTTKVQPPAVMLKNRGKYVTDNGPFFPSKAAETMHGGQEATRLLPNIVY